MNESENTWVFVSGFSDLGECLFGSTMMFHYQFGVPFHFSIAFHYKEHTECVSLSNS